MSVRNARLNLLPAFNPGMSRCLLTFWLGYLLPCGLLRFPDGEYGVQLTLAEELDLFISQHPLVRIASSVGYMQFLAASSMIALSQAHLYK